MFKNLPSLRLQSIIEIGLLRVYSHEQTLYLSVLSLLLKGGNEKKDCRFRCVVSNLKLHFPTGHLVKHKGAISVLEQAVSTVLPKGKSGQRYQ